MAQLDASELQSFEENVNQRALEIGLTPFDAALAPRKAVHQLAVARGHGYDVENLLVDRASIMRIESAKKSLPSIRSALNSWHEFATLVLNYNEESSLRSKSAALF